MKTLILHNDNVNVTFRSLFNTEERLSPSLAEMLLEDFDLDSFLHNRLLEILSEQKYDYIYLPYSFNNEDYLQFTGLIVALHIRLSPILGHTNVPIVFIGRDKIEHIFKLNPLGSLLFTPGIYQLKNGSLEEKKLLESRIKPQVDEDNYQLFLTRIQIDPPANYSSYHSLANEWGVKRWADLFGKANLPAKLQDDISKLEKQFETRLYFKLLEARLDIQRKKFRAKDTIPATIANLGPGNIVYIDDEYEKGWALLLEYLFVKADASLNLIPFKNFHREEPRAALLSKLETFLTETDVAQARLYIIDLRLCDEDRNEKNHKQLTGILLLKLIRKANPGNQVILFTASNKSWNQTAAMDEKAAGYVLKESPELNYTIEQSKMLFTNFSKAVNQGFGRAYLKDFWTFVLKARVSGKGKWIAKNDFSERLLEEGGWLEQIFTLLSYDSNKVYKQILVTFVAILEAYAEAMVEDANEMVVTRISASDLVIREKGYRVGFDFIFERYLFQKNDDKQIVSISFFQPLVSNPSIVNSNAVKGLKLKIGATLHYNHGYSPDMLRDIFILVFLRNNLGAHESENNLDKHKRWLQKSDMNTIINTLQKLFASVFLLNTLTCQWIVLSHISLLQ